MREGEREEKKRARICVEINRKRWERERVFDGRDKNALRERRVKEKEMGRERKREREFRKINIKLCYKWKLSKTSKRIDWIDFTFALLMKYIRAHSITSLLCLSFSLEMNGIKKTSRERDERVWWASLFSLSLLFFSRTERCFIRRCCCAVRRRRQRRRRRRRRRRLNIKMRPRRW